MIIGAFNQVIIAKPLKLPPPEIRKPVEAIAVPNHTLEPQIHDQLNQFHHLKAPKNPSNLMGIIDALEGLEGDLKQRTRTLFIASTLIQQYPERWREVSNMMPILWIQWKQSLDDLSQFLKSAEHACIESQCRPVCRYNSLLYTYMIMNPEYILEVDDELILFMMDSILALVMTAGTTMVLKQLMMMAELILGQLRVTYMAKEGLHQESNVPKCSRREMDAVCSNLMNAYPGVYIPREIHVKPSGREPILLAGVEPIPLAIREALNVLDMYVECTERQSYQKNISFECAQVLGKHDAENQTKSKNSPLSKINTFLVT